MLRVPEGRGGAPRTRTPLAANRPEAPPMKRHSSGMGRVRPVLVAEMGPQRGAGTSAAANSRLVAARAGTMARPPPVAAPRLLAARSAVSRQVLQRRAVMLRPLSIAAPRRRCGRRGHGRSSGVLQRRDGLRRWQRRGLSRRWRGRRSREVSCRLWLESPPLSLRTRGGRGPWRGLGSPGGGDLVASPLTGDSDSGGSPGGDGLGGDVIAGLGVGGESGSSDGCDHHRSGSGPGDGSGDGRLGEDVLPASRPGGPAHDSMSYRMTSGGDGRPGGGGSGAGHEPAVGGGGGGNAGGAGSSDGEWLAPGDAGGGGVAASASGGAASPRILASAAAQSVDCSW